MQPQEMGDARARAWVERIENNQRLETLSDPLQMQVRGFLEGSTGRGARSVLRGDWLGHPLHPVLTDLPIGAWTAAMIFDLASLTGSRDLRRAAQASVAVGIVGAVGAAITGMVDWSETEGKAQRVGVMHAALNSVGLGFQIASLSRRRTGRSSGRLLSAMGYAISAAAAYLGGKLVYNLGTRVEVQEQPSYTSTRGEAYGTDFTGELQ